MSGQRQRVHLIAKVTGLTLAGFVIAWATLAGLGYTSFNLAMMVTAVLMVVAIVVTWTTRAQ